MTLRERDREIHTHSGDGSGPAIIALVVVLVLGGLFMLAWFTDAFPFDSDIDDDADFIAVSNPVNNTSEREIVRERTVIVERDDPNTIIVERPGERVVEREIIIIDRSGNASNSTNSSQN